MSDDGTVKEEPDKVQEEGEVADDGPFEEQPPQEDEPSADEELPAPAADEELPAPAAEEDLPFEEEAPAPAAAEGDDPGPFEEEAPAPAEDAPPAADPPAADDALDIRAEDVDELNDYDEADIDYSREPIKPLGAAALWGEEYGISNPKPQFKALPKTERKQWKRMAQRARAQYENHCEEYRKQNPDWDPSQAQSMKKRKKKRRQWDSNDPKPRKKRKKRRPMDDEIGEYPQDDPGGEYPQGNFQQEPQEEEQQLGTYDLAVNALKNQKRRKKKNDDVNIGGDLEVAAKAFVAKMHKAAARDEEAVTSKPPRPAFSCFSLLKQLEEHMQKPAYRGLLLDCDLLDAMRDWLRPYPSGMLPLKEVRTKLYEILGKAQLHRVTDVKEYFERSQERANEMVRRGELRQGTEGFCKTFAMLWKHPRESVANKRKIQKLIQSWVRPLVHAPISFKGVGVGEDPSAQERFKAIQAQKRRQLVPDSKRERARVPERPYFAFNKMPQVKEFEQKAQQENIKRKSIQNKFKYIMMNSKGSNKQSSRVSVNGKRTK